MSLELPKGPGSWPKMTDQKRQEVYSKLLDLKGETYKAGREKIAKDILTKITATSNKYELSKPVKDLGKHPVSQAILDAFTQAGAENPNALMFYSLDYLVSADENKALNGGKIPNVDLLEPKDHVAIVKDPTGRWRINVARGAEVRFTGYLFPPLTAATEPPKAEQQTITTEDRTETGQFNAEGQLTMGERKYKDGRTEKGTFKENALFTGEFTQNGQTYGINEGTVLETNTAAAAPEEDVANPVDTDTGTQTETDTEATPADKEEDVANPVDTDTGTQTETDTEEDVASVPANAEGAQAEAPTPAENTEAQTEIQTAKAALEKRLAETNPNLGASVEVSKVIKAKGIIVAKVTYTDGSILEGTFDQKSSGLNDGTMTMADGTIRNFENGKEVVKIKLPETLKIAKSAGYADIQAALIAISEAGHSVYHEVSASNAGEYARIYINDGLLQDTILMEGAIGSETEAKELADEFNRAISALSRNPEVTLTITE